MSEKEGMDIGRIVGLIMENPALIEQISNLARSTEKTDEVIKDPEQTAAVEEANTPVAAPEPATYNQHSDSYNRQRLLGALKPYVSEERAKAIDSMISIAEILDMMRAR